MRVSLFARALIGVALLTTGVACGDDDKSDGAAFCDVASKFAESDPDEKVFDEAIAVAEGKTKTDVENLKAAFGKAAAVPDDMGFLTDEFREAYAAGVVAIVEECKYDTVDVGASEYSLAGLAPKGPGITAFRLENSGSELHEMLLYRRGKTDSDDLVAIINDNPSVDDGRLQEIGVTLPIEKGEETYLLANLTKGDYVAVCFINQGIATRADIRQELPEPTKDHRSLGMIKQFSVG